MPSISSLRDRDPDAPSITMLTAYDSATAAVVDEAGIDIILVGDSMGDNVLGYDSTLPVTVDEVASRTGAVARSVDEAIVIADMPFLSFGVDEATSIENAGRMLKEEDADGVKLESGSHTVELTRRMVDLGIPVMAHLGLTPQRIRQLGLTKQATDAEAAAELRRLALEHEEAGAFSLVLEHIPAELAAVVTEDLSIPTIGIGAGPDTDGQVLVINDVFGFPDRLAPFAESFGDVKGEMQRAVTAYRDAVLDGEFPAAQHTDDTDLDIE